MRAWEKARPSVNFGNSTSISDRRCTSSPSANACSSFFRRTPIGVLRPRRVSPSACQRFRLTVTGSSAGIAASSPTKRQLFGCRAPCCSRAIKGLLEGIDADAAHIVEEPLALAGTVGEVDVDDGVDRRDDVVLGERGADDLAERGVILGRAADGHLVEFLPLLVDAQDADMADMVMTAGIDAAGDVEPQLADVVQLARVAEMARQALRHRDRARVGEVAVVEARAGDDVADEAEIGGRELRRPQALP